MKLRPDEAPLVHCITNPISIRMNANAILALGRRPMMAEHPKEIKEITQTAGAVCVNLGNITDARMKSIMISIKTANRYKIPVVVDLVGIACSGLRRKFALKLLKKHSAEIITGTYFAPLGFTKGILAIIIGHIIGCILLFCAGIIGAKTEKSAMETVTTTFLDAYSAGVSTESIWSKVNGKYLSHNGHYGFSLSYWIGFCTNDCNSDCRFYDFEKKIVRTKQLT